MRVGSESMSDIGLNFAAITDIRHPSLFLPTSMMHTNTNMNTNMNTNTPDIGVELNIDIASKPISEKETFPTKFSPISD
jgi:hypothetical protein